MQQTKRSADHVIPLSITRTIITHGPEHNASHFSDDIFKYISLNDNHFVLIQTLLSFVPEGPVDNMSTVIQVIVCQAIIWSNDVPVHWRICASPGVDVLCYYESLYRFDRKCNVFYISTNPLILLKVAYYSVTIVSWKLVTFTIGFDDYTDPLWWNYINS